VPLPIVVRRANAKSLGEIHEEIRSAQEQPLAASDVHVAGPSAFVAAAGEALAAAGVPPAQLHMAAT
jgi:ferredoxin-NADP reductase